MAWGASLPFHLSQFPGDPIMPEKDCSHGAQGAFDEWFGFDAAAMPLESVRPKVASSDLVARLEARRMEVDVRRSSLRRPFFAWLRACPVPPGDLGGVPSFQIGPCPSSDDGGAAALPGVHGKWLVRRDVAVWRLRRDRKRLWEMFFVTCLQRIGYIVFRDPASGAVTELKRPIWLKNEDKA